MKLFLLLFLFTRPLFQWAGMIAVGDTVQDVSEALKAAQYPALTCGANRLKLIATTCHSSNDDGLFTANFGDDGRWLSLEDASKDPPHENYRATKSELSALLGTPKPERRNDLTWLIWHQREDGSRVTLGWVSGSYVLSMKSKSLPED